MKKTISMFMAFIMVSSLAFIAAAESGRIDVTVCQDRMITVDGVAKEFTNNRDETLYPIRYNRTTYLPLKALVGSEGKVINHTVNRSTNLKSIEAEAAFRSNITVMVDGLKTTIHPIVYARELYLPAKIIAEASGKTYKWDSGNAVITIGSSPQSSPNALTAPRSDTVYWTTNGQVYHSIPTCRSLARSSNIKSGSIAQSGKSRGCNNCVR